MAGISTSTADAASSSPPPEPPAGEGHGGGADHDDGDGNNDNDDFFPLLDLLERFPDLFALKVLVHLDPIDRTFLAQTGGACRAAVAASNLLRAGTREAVPGKSVWVATHKVRGFCTSVERLVWAKNNGCPWVALTCANAAAYGGKLEVLKWARVHDCPWNTVTCYWAALRGHLEVLQWARAHGCPWSKSDCAVASWYHTETLAWVLAQPE
jgi:hypothetical protein